MDTFADIEAAARDTAYARGKPPTPAQAAAQNYKKGRLMLHGLRVAIETPRNHYREGVGADGKPWRTRAAAHYGHFLAYKGADGDGMDVFIGPVPESERAWVINQRNVPGGAFDEHKVMLGFPDEESARTAYLHSYERGWNGLASIIPLTLEQLKWWLRNGNHNVALTTSALPYDGTSTMDNIAWDSAANPVGTDLPGLLYLMRREDADGLLLDAVSVAEIMEDADGEVALDALVTQFAKLDRKVAQMQSIMAAAGDKVKPVASQTTPPFKQRGTTNVAAVFELSDGQTVSIFFHNPDVSPNKITPADTLVSWKWMLNKKDVTILVAPEKGSDLNVREVARRIMRIAEKNSARFASANSKRAERLAAIEGMKSGVEEKKATLAALESEIAVLEPKVIARRARKAKAQSVGRTLADGRNALNKIKDFLSKGQFKTMSDAMQGEEGQFFIDTAVSMAYVIDTMPKSYEQDGKGGDAIAFLHYFKGGSDWYITEKDMDGGVDQAFGLASINGEYPELGYISIRELAQNGVELDLHWTPKTLGAIKGGDTTEEQKDDGVTLTSLNVFVGAKIVSKTNPEWGEAKITGSAEKGWTFTNRAGTSVLPFGEMKFWNLVGGKPQAATEEAIDPTSAEGYLKVIYNDDLKIKYQDTLDSFFGGRIVDVRNSLRDMGWVGEQGGPLTKNGITATFTLQQVGAGRNVVGYIVSLDDRMKQAVRDDLSMTATEFAKYIDDSLPKTAVEPGATSHPIDQFAEMMKRLGWMPEERKTDPEDRVNEGDRMIDFTRGRDSLVAEYSDRDKSVTVTYESMEYGQGLDNWKSLADLAAEVDQAAWLSNQDIIEYGDYTEDNEDGSDVITKEGHEFEGKTLNYVFAVQIIKDYAKSNGLDVSWGNFEDSLRSGSLLDSAYIYGVTAQIGKGGVLIGRISVNERGQVTVYSGSAGENIIGSTTDKRPNRANIADAMAGLAVRASDIKEPEFDPTTFENYVKVRMDEELELKYQDVLDAALQKRLVETRNALIDLGWSGGSRTMSKGEYIIEHHFKQVGAGKNIVGVSHMVVKDGGVEKVVGDRFQKTPAEIAAELDAVVPKTDIAVALAEAAEKIGMTRHAADLWTWDVDRENGVTEQVSIEVKSEGFAVLRTIYIPGGDVNGSDFDGKTFADVASAGEYAASLIEKVKADKAGDQAAEADEQAKYAKFDPASVRMPTPAQLRMNVNGVFRLIMVEKTNGWTNGHLLDLANVPKAIKTGMDKYGLTLENAQFVPEDAVNKVVASAKSAARVKLEPTANFDDAGDKTTPAIKAIVLVNDKEGVASAIDRAYFSYFFKVYKGCEFYGSGDPMKALVVKHKGRIVGIVMPMNRTGALKRAVKAARPEAPDVQIPGADAKIVPAGAPGDRLQWEEGVYAMIEKTGMTRSDAQGVAEAKAALMDEMFAAGKSPQETADAILAEATPANSELVPRNETERVALSKGFDIATMRKYPNIAGAIKAGATKYVAYKNPGMGQHDPQGYIEGGGIKYPVYWSQIDLVKELIQEFSKMAKSSKGSPEQSTKIASITSAIEAAGLSVSWADAVGSAYKVGTVSRGGTKSVLVDVSPDGDVSLTTLGGRADVRAEVEAALAGKPAAEDPAVTEAKTYLQSVIDQSIDLMEPEVADRLVAINDAHAGNAEVMDLFNKAADSYSNFMVEAAKKAMG